jgi:hypothetical protein
MGTGWPDPGTQESATAECTDARCGHSFPADSVMTLLLAAQRHANASGHPVRLTELRSTLLRPLPAPVFREAET